jgi:hypothetical protein
VEYKHGEDLRYRDWHVGQRFKVDGPALRDTDRWELVKCIRQNPSNLYFAVVQQTHLLALIPTAVPLT